MLSVQKWQVGATATTRARSEPAGTTWRSASNCSPTAASGGRGPAACGLLKKLLRTRIKAAIAHTRMIAMLATVSRVDLALGVGGVVGFVSMIVSVNCLR